MSLGAFTLSITDFIFVLEESGILGLCAYIIVCLRIKLLKKLMHVCICDIMSLLRSSYVHTHRRKYISSSLIRFCEIETEQKSCKIAHNTLAYTLYTSHSVN